LLLFAKVVSLGNSAKEIERNLNDTLNEIPDGCFVEDVKIVHNSISSSCYAIVLCNEQQQLTEKEIVDKQIMEAMEEEQREEYAKKYGIHYGKKKKKA